MLLHLNVEDDNDDV